MEGSLKKGSVLISESGDRYEITAYLGEGGQGEVYDVICTGKHFALKWFFKHMATARQKSILDNLITKGAPDKSFLWPQDIIYSRPGEPFGYIMPLRPKNYKGIVDMMKRRAEPSFAALSRAAFNLAGGYEKLHSMGLCYGDISFGNAFLNPENGEVLICDTDNVVPNGEETDMLGTPRFMAPEIVRGDAKPSRNSDQYSLAVLLFYMLMLGHPLDGKLEADIKALDPVAMRWLYGENPVFVYDAENKSNRPVHGIHDNVIIYWQLYPQPVRDLFTTAFTTGLTSPNKRVTEKRWMDLFANLISGIAYCPKCGAEVFFDETKAQVNVAHTCWNCQDTIKMPAALVIGKNRILLQEGAKLYSHNLYDDYDMVTAAGSVTRNPNNPDLWGIRNESQNNWTYIRPDGTNTPVAVGNSAAIVKGASINFGVKTGGFV